MTEPSLRDRLFKAEQDIKAMQTVLGVLAQNLKTHGATLAELARVLKDPE